MKRAQTACSSEVCEGLITQRLFQFSCSVKCFSAPRPPTSSPPRHLRISSPNSIGARPEIIRDGEQTRKGDIGKALKLVLKELKNRDPAGFAAAELLVTRTRHELEGRTHPRLNGFNPPRTTRDHCRADNQSWAWLQLHDGDDLYLNRRRTAFRRVNDSETETPRNSDTKICCSYVASNFSGLLLHWVNMQTGLNPSHSSNISSH